MAVILARALSYDQDLYHEDEEKQINSFKEAIDELMNKFDKFAEFWSAYKREIFFRLYAKEGLEGICDESMQALLSMASLDYVYSSIDELERSTSDRAQKIYKSMYGIKCSSLLENRNNCELNRRERIQISKRMEKDALKLFVDIRTR